MLVVQADSELGILVYEQKIEITHRTKGPLFVLYQSAQVGNNADLEALNEFAYVLANRLGMRLIGTRGSLHSLRSKVAFTDLTLVVGLILFVGFFAAVKFS